jgi:hypothetical protein
MSYNTWARSTLNDSAHRIFLLAPLALNSKVYRGTANELARRIPKSLGEGVVDAYKCLLGDCREHSEIAGALQRSKESFD